MFIKEIMSINLHTLKPKNTILEACKLMRNTDCGFLVIVDDNNNPLGVCTDRDIVLKLAQDKNLGDQIGTIMKKNIISINENAKVEDASDLMGNMQIKRLVVLNDQKKLIGIVSLADFARNILLEEFAFEILTEISYDLKNLDKKSKTSLQVDTYQV